MSKASSSVVPSDDSEHSSYFRRYEHRSPPIILPMSPLATSIWQCLAGLTIGLGLWYLHWRWTVSLNPDALTFSVLVALAETAAFLGTLLFFFDIWSEGDTAQKPPPRKRRQVGLDGDGPIAVDIFVTTFDEGVCVVRPTLSDACQVIVPDGVSLSISLLDDGKQPGMRALAEEFGVDYLSRDTNHGFKAGNLRSALMQTRGDFIVICDADTRLFPSFLQNTLGYFRDDSVAWVQTPHWFYDVPDGQNWENLIRLANSSVGRSALRMLRRLSTKETVGEDPFLSDPIVFFDVIQRRRNRNHASFCCGAGSIHRREAIFSNALDRQIQDAKRSALICNLDVRRTHFATNDLQPFCYHVSEDILTSIKLHSIGWRSVFHPKIEARMLSPWSIEAWATQKLKYAGGTLDIMFRNNPIFSRAMPWRCRLHYAATFWSYFAVLWLPILLVAPVVSLLTGIAPVEAYSVEFFLHLLPLLLVNELAMFVACKGYDTHAGRALAVATLSIQVRALAQVLLGKRPKFPATPKTPGTCRDWRHAKPAIGAVLIVCGASSWAVYATLNLYDGYSFSLLIVNIFWLLWNCGAYIRLLRMSVWLPPSCAESSESVASTPRLQASI